MPFSNIERTDSASVPAPAGAEARPRLGPMPRFYPVHAHSSPSLRPVRLPGPAHELLSHEWTPRLAENRYRLDVHGVREEVVGGKRLDGSTFFDHRGDVACQGCGIARHKSNGLSIRCC